MRDYGRRSRSSSCPAASRHACSSRPACSSTAPTRRPFSSERRRFTMASRRVLTIRPACGCLLERIGATSCVSATTDIYVAEASGATALCGLRTRLIEVEAPVVAPVELAGDPRTRRPTAERSRVAPPRALSPADTATTKRASTGTRREDDRAFARKPSRPVLGEVRTVSRVRSRALP